MLDADVLYQALDEADDLITAGSYTAAASACDRLAALAASLATALREAAKTPPPAKAQVGDLIGPNAAGVAENVVEVADSNGDLWTRAVGEQRYARQDDGSIDRETECDWTAPGGWCTTGGLLDSVPLRVTRIAEEDPAVAAGLGPRRVGGRYYCGYWGVEYTVLDISVGPVNGWMPWSVTEATDAERAAGTQRTHCTAWDDRRDRVIFQPDEQDQR